MTMPDTRDQLRTTLAQARASRHFVGCRCFMFRAYDGAPYCTREEASWSAMADRILTTLLREDRGILRTVQNLDSDVIAPKQNS